MSESVVDCRGLDVGALLGLSLPETSVCDALRSGFGAIFRGGILPGVGGVGRFFRGIPTVNN